jgi:hypothetical protein
MSKRSLLAVAVCTVALAGVGASGALAGEVTGNGNETGMRGHANSECGFSGREDEAGSPLRTQTPHEVWLAPPGPGVVNPPPGTPGEACNGHLNPQK